MSKVDLRLAPVLSTNAKGQPKFQWKIVRRFGDRVDEILRNRKSEGARALKDAIEDALKAGHTVHAMFVDQTGGGVEGDYALDGTMKRRAISPKEGLLGPRCFEIPITQTEAAKRRAAARPPKKAVSGKPPKRGKKPSVSKVPTPKAPSAKKPTPAKALPEMMVAYYKATDDGLDSVKVEKWAKAHAKLRGPVTMWLRKNGTAAQRSVLKTAREVIIASGKTKPSKKPSPAKVKTPSKKPTPAKAPSGKTLPPAIAAFESAAAGKVGEAVQYLQAIGTPKLNGLKLGFRKAKGVPSGLRDLFKKALDKVEAKVSTSKPVSAKKPTTRPPKTPSVKKPTPKAPTPKVKTPKVKTPKAPTPKVKTPKAPTPKATTGGEAAFAAQLAQLFG